MKKFLLSSIIFSILILTACAPAAPIATATSVPSEAPTIQPSSTPTATPTLEPTIEATATQPAPPANPEFVEGIGKITSVAQRGSDNKWYGLNELGMAVTIQNEKGEWVPYQRPMKLAQYGEGTDKALFTIESLGLKEIKPEDVTRLKGGVLDIEWLPTITHPTADELKKVHDDVLTFGVVLEEQPYKSDDRLEWLEWKDFTHVYISGINRGVISTQIENRQTTTKGDKITLTFLIYEVPLQFESQIILILLPDQKFNANDSVFLVPDSNNVQDAKRHGMTDHDIMMALSANKSVGDQLIIAIQMFYPPSESTKYPYNNAYGILVNGLKTGNAVNIDFGYNSISRIFMPKP